MDRIENVEESAGHTYSTEDEILDAAALKHSQTTKHAKEAAQTAQRTVDLAKDTLVSLKGQGEQMNRIQGQYEEIEHDVDTAESLLAWLGRCCWCCNCCRPANPRPKGGWGGKHHKPQPDAVVKPQQQMTRQEKKRGGVKGEGPASVKQHIIGNGLDGEKAEKLRRETREQDAYLDQVEQSLGMLQEMGQAMRTEVDKQSTRANDLQEHTRHMDKRVKDVRRHDVLRNV